MFSTLKETFTIKLSTRSQGLMAHLIYLNSYEMNLSDLSHSQICQRVRSVICEAVWEAMRVRSERPCGRPIGLSRTAGDAVRSWASRTSAGRSNAFSRGSDCIARCAWESDRPPTRPLTSDSQICESCDLSESPKWEAVLGLPRPHRFESPIGLTRPHRFESPIGLSRTLAESPILGTIWLISRLNALPHPLESDRTPTASHAHGLSDLGVRGADRPLTHTGRCSPILGAAWLISRLNALLRPGVRERPIGILDSHVPHRSERPCAWEAVLPWLAQTDHMTKVRGRERPWEAVGLSLA